MRSPAPRLHFPPDDGFHAALKRRVASYFERAGTPPQGGRSMHRKTVAIAGWFGASYALLLAFGGTAAWLAVALTVSLALATAGIGFSVMHDANHGAYSPSKVVNRGVGLALDLIGGSSYVWRFKHNVHHHSYANVDGMDTDIDAAPLLRLAPSQRWRAFHRWQASYAWLLYGALALKWWLIDDVANVVRGRIGDHPFPRPRGLALAALAAGKVVFLGWTLVIPALIFRSAWVGAFFVLGAFLLGLVLSTVFQLAHTVADAEFHAGADAGGRMSAAWAEHQVRASVDFAPSSRMLTWYLGGLNFQIEHHLFPGVCHVHYPALAGIVQETCRDHAIPYRVQRTLRQAVAAHQTHLRALGRAPPVSQEA